MYSGKDYYFKGFKYKPINGNFFGNCLKKLRIVFVKKKSPKIGVKTKPPLEFSNESKATPGP